MSNLKNNLTEALVILGCDAHKFNFDDKSLIAMHFRDVEDVLIDPQDDGVWIWGSLPEVPVEAMRGSALDLLQTVAEPVPYLTSDCLCVRATEPQWRVGGQLRPEYVQEPKHLAAAIEGFYLRLSHARDVLK